MTQVSKKLSEDKALKIHLAYQQAGYISYTIFYFGRKK